MLMLPQIARHPYLDALGLIVNTRLRIVCCEWCQIALPAREFREHLLTSKEHRGWAAKFDRQAFSSALAAFQVPEARLPPPPVRGSSTLEVKGLKLHLGYLCWTCGKGLKEMGSMRKHHHTRHPDLPVPTSWSRVWIQQFNRAGQREFFTVHRMDSLEASTSARPDALLESRLPSLIRSLIDDGDSENVEDAGEGGEQPSALNARQVSPWLLSTRWHLHTHACNPAELKELVRLPTRGEEALIGLEDSVKEYFRWATERIPLVEELVLQRLVTPEPAKSVTSPPLSLLPSSTFQPFRQTTDWLARVHVQGSEPSPSLRTPAVQHVGRLLQDRPASSVHAPAFEGSKQHSAAR